MCERSCIRVEIIGGIPVEALRATRLTLGFGATGSEAVEALITLLRGRLGEAPISMVRHIPFLKAGAHTGLDHRRSPTDILIIADARRQLGAADREPAGTNRKIRSRHLDKCSREV